MLDINKIINHKDEVEELLRARDPSISLDSVLAYAAVKRNANYELEELNRKINSSVKNMPSKGTPEFEDYITKMTELKNKKKPLELASSQADKTLKDELLSLPNIIRPTVPRSYNKEDKDIIRFGGGEKPKFDFKMIDHMNLAISRDLIDFPRATKLAQSGFPLYKNKGARLEWALINFMIDKAINNGFEFLLFPLLNNTKSLTASGNLPKFKEEIYSCIDDDLHIIPTAEVPLTNFYRGEILDSNKLPIRMVSYSPCFRREAGSYGKMAKGLMRLHQFNKVETYVITSEENSEEEFQNLIKNGESILEDLGLHYRLANLPSCDLATQSAQTYDIEIWLPKLQEYSEVSSASHCLDFQSRRASIRHKSKGNKPALVHTLNCSALATPRVMIALLETYQQADGSINVPEVLQSYVGVDKL